MFWAILSGYFAVGLTTFKVAVHRIAEFVLRDFPEQKGIPDKNDREEIIGVSAFMSLFWPVTIVVFFFRKLGKLVYKLMFPRGIATKEGLREMARRKVAQAEKEAKRLAEKHGLTWPSEEKET